jgi:dTDP-4-amino-4,6-dideoxy-D-galactose acyltransferase
MLQNTLTELEWDSVFFGYKVALISFDQNGKNHVDELIEEIISKGIRLTYVLTSPSDDYLNDIIKRTGGILADTRIKYSKNTEPHYEFKNIIKEFTDNKPTIELTELAIQAGKYSRFRIDENFTNNEYERLYKQWLINSLNKELAFKVLVAIEGIQITGFTTLGDKNSCADIGLVAVDRNFTGRGIGTDLVHYADNTAYNMNYHEIKVVTQKRNQIACNLYEKCNFQVENITNIYHFWQ